MWCTCGSTSARAFAHPGSTRSFNGLMCACVMNLTVRRVAVLTIDVVWFSRDGFTGVWNRVGMRFDCILTEVVGTLGR